MRTDRLRAARGVIEAEASVGGLVRVEFDRSQQGSEQSIRHTLGLVRIAVTKFIGAAHSPVNP